MHLIGKSSSVQQQQAQRLNAAAEQSPCQVLHMLQLTKTHFYAFVRQQEAPMRGVKYMELWAIEGA